MKLPNEVRGYLTENRMTDGSPCYVVEGDPFTGAAGIYGYAPTRDEALESFIRAVDAVRRVVGDCEEGEARVTWVLPAGPVSETSCAPLPA